MSIEPNCMAAAHLLTTHHSPPTNYNVSRRTRITTTWSARMSHMTTEARNPASDKIDTLSPLEIVRLMNAEDARVAEAVGREAEPIARAVQVIADRLKAGGRLVYI